MQKIVFPPPRRFFSLPDLLILALIGTVIYGVVQAGRQWHADYHPFTQIDLSIWALPRYTLFSAIRGMTAYVCSLIFTLIVGYVAAKSKPAEKIIIPMLDILQSVPVLAFLPGLTLGLVALFPTTNTGLELAAVLSIFTGQVWNMTFSFYSSLKSVPTDLVEAATVIDLGRRERLLRLELPYSAVGLAWNSLMSMAGGWFFLAVCEAFKIGDREFRLPGVGAYMQVAINKGDVRAMCLGVLAMTILIVSMDFFLWRPILAWVHRFRLADMEGAAPPDPLMSAAVRESRLVRWLRIEVRRFLFYRRHGNSAERTGEIVLPPPQTQQPPQPGSLDAAMRAHAERATQLVLKLAGPRQRWMRILEAMLIGATGGVILWGVWNLFRLLSGVDFPTWVMVARNALWTFLRVLSALFISTLWAVPAGIWIGTSQRRVRIAQPIVQVLASFPAPMLYPLVIGVLLSLGVGFGWGSMLLMLLGVQWYVLFNVLAGALRIPLELKYALELMKSSRWEKWKTLYIPSVFPALVTGWVTAAGGAWNASIVAEYAQYKGGIMKTGGLGSTISEATDHGDFRLLAASLVVMVVVVLSFNRTLWARLYHEAQNRFRMDI